MKHVRESIAYWCDLLRQQEYNRFDYPTVLEKYSEAEILDKLSTIPILPSNEPLVAVEHHRFLPPIHEDNWRIGIVIEFHRLSTVKNLTSPIELLDLADTLYDEIDPGLVQEIESFRTNRYAALSELYYASVFRFVKMTPTQRQLITLLLSDNTPAPEMDLNEGDYFDALYDNRAGDFGPIIIAEDYLLSSLKPIIEHNDSITFLGEASILPWIYKDLKTDWESAGADEKDVSSQPEEAMSEIIKCVNSWSHYVNLLRCQREIELGY